ncbi:IclR family transcriptional regulator [Streptomyces sp. NRRL F-4489]|uniref:IclR family transcriptional regulator domain-containing protein n=1 Tax=Streptomyces sp. NRRL F-4489 TaxID=1609095 RepID=UPI000749F80D|nr:IclR family transcriptional regulator C-terminal domain-containing protein [Streptomyces sp. NRRL F-4489]KUL46081.1 IclR family transcriptional regulator [Streptomyces sp. NRRL F-4489]
MPQPDPRFPDAPAELVGPLARGLALLRTMGAAPEVRQRPGDLARATGLARSTVDRIATTLTRLGHLRAEGRDLLLAPGAMALSNAYLAASGLPGLLGPLAVDLADRLDESVSLAVPDGDGVRFVTQATRRRTMAIAFRIGDLLPAERCAPGALFADGWDAEQQARWLLRLRRDPLHTGFPAVPPRPAPARPDEVAAAFLDRVRAARDRGFSLDDQLIEPGLVAVALPVRDPSGAPVCALSVVSHTSRHDAGSLAGHALPPLRETVAEMERRLAAPRPAPPAPAAAPSAGALKEELGSGFLQSLARGLDVLCALGAAPDGAPLAEIARSTGLPRATARRSLLTLRHLGYVAADDEGFRLLPRVLELGCARLSGLPLPEIARPHLVDLVRRVGESASAAVLDGDDIRYVARVPTTRVMRLDLTVGTRLPAYATAMGRVLLAALPDAERAAFLRRVAPRPLTPYTVAGRAALARAVAAAGRDGHALVEQELEEGLRSLAVPVRDGHGRVVAAVNVALHAGRGTPEESRAALLPALREAAGRIGADLAAVGRWTGTPAA